MTDFSTGSDGDSEIAIASSDSEVFIKVWEFESEEKPPLDLESDLESEEAEDQLKADKIFAKTLKRGPSSTDFSRRDDHEQLWKEWEKDIPKYSEMERIKLDLEKSIKEVSDPDHFKRQKTENLELQAQILKGFGKDIPKALLQELLSDKYDTTKDWYFIVSEPDFSIIPSTYDRFLGRRFELLPNDLFEKFGCDVVRKVSLAYCPYNDLIPVETMCTIIEENFENSAKFFEYFVKFILDRQISVNLPMNWCVRCWNKFNMDKLKVYFNLIPNDMYMLHYRLTRMIPMQQQLVDFMFPDEKHLMEELRRLLRTQDWNGLLYLFLFVFGSNKLPFGSTKEVAHFRAIMEDLDIVGSNQVQLSIIKSYIATCIKL